MRVRSISAKSLYVTIAVLHLETPITTLFMVGYGFLLKQAELF